MARRKPSAFRKVINDAEKYGPDATGQHLKAQNPNIFVQAKSADWNAVPKLSSQIANKTVNVQAQLRNIENRTETSVEKFAVELEKL